MNDQTYLLYALQLAQEYLGQCAPNPSVGALLVSKNQVLARSAHKGAGHAHAESQLLEGFGTIPADAKLYVTLEPCCHVGRTPPCTDAIIASGVREVYFAYLDPNPKVCGQGMHKLRKAGIHCQQVNVPEINQFYQEYTHWVNTGLPWVRAKLALSLDGKIANHDGSPLKLTAHTVDQFTHEKRYRSDAILTSCRTLLADDPQLNARLYGKKFSKRVYVLDSQCRMNTHLKLFDTAREIIVFCSDQAPSKNIAVLESAGVQCRRMALKAGALPMRSVIQQIGDDGCHSVWVEAGGTCFQSLLHHYLMNVAYLYYAPKIMGPQAKSAFTEGFRLDVTPKWQQMGVDSVCEIAFDTQSTSASKPSQKQGVTIV